MVVYSQQTLIFEMPRNGSTYQFSFPSKFSFSSSTSPPPLTFSSPSRLRLPSTETAMSRALDTAEPVIMKWNPETTSYARVTSLFYQNRAEARDFIGAVNNLQKAMHSLLKADRAADKLARAQRLIQIAMKTLQKEFYQILSVNRAHLDPESLSSRSTASSTSVDYDEDDGDSVIKDKDTISEVEDSSTLAMEDLRLIAECMISSGYAKECFDIYKSIRKSIVDEGIYRLGVQLFPSSQIRKMDWRALEVRIRSWITAIPTALKILFNGERILCDHVFAISDSIRESCFTEIAREGAMILFVFPENVAKNSKKSPEKIFRVLDMYAALAAHWQEIDAIFSFRSTIHTKSQALTSLIKIGEFVRAALEDFEKDVSKKSTKLPNAGVGIHQLTIDTMTYLSILADYGNNFSDILTESPHAKRHVLPANYESNEAPAAAVSHKIAWLILVLLCKLDATAEHYKDVSAAYLFLANNLQYVVVKVRRSNLGFILGEEWVKKHEVRVKQFAEKYERLGWSDVVGCIPSDRTAAETPPEKVEEICKEFYNSFNQAYKKQSVCVVPDSELREDIKCSIARKIVPLYREFYYARRPTMATASVVRFTPEKLRNCLWDLFSQDVDSGASSSFPPPF